MQKLLKRTAQAEKQALRRSRKNAWLGRRADFADRRIQVSKMQREVNHQVKMARIARREDWEMGPLAPRRDVPWAPQQPNDDYKKFMYGSISNDRTKTAFKLSPGELAARCAWAGGPKNLCLEVGDRIVMMEGAEKGRIGSIVDIDKEMGLIKLAGIMETNVTVPPWLLEDEQNVQPMETHVPVDAVRLVHPLTDPATGRTRDVIIRHLEPANHVYDKPTRKHTFDRFVPGLNVTIPWPPRAPEAEAEDFESDTLRIDLEPSSYVPTLLRPPMPADLVDELRNKYSRFRTRHEKEYLAKREAAEAEKKAMREATSMRTPLQEFNIKQRDIRRARGQPVLSEEMLQKIGEVMLKNQKSLSALESGVVGNNGQMPPPPLPNVDTDNRAPLP